MEAATLTLVGRCVLRTVGLLPRRMEAVGAFGAVGDISLRPGTFDAVGDGGVWWWMHHSWRGVLCLVLGLVRMCVVMRWRVWWLVSRPRRWVGFWGTGVGR